MRSLNLDQLRALVDVVELGGFSAAARRLNLTQPAVSLQIRELESRFAAPLVKRVGKRTYATDAGRELIEHARSIFDSTNRALAAMRRHKDGHMGRVHVGSGSAMLAYLLLPVLQKLREDYPDLELAVTTGNTSEITERMLKNAVDIGVTGLPVDERVFEAVFLREMRMVAILPAGEADIPSVVRPADIAKRPLIVTHRRSNNSQLAREWFRAAGLEIQPAMEIDNFEAIKRVVSAGLGVALIPEDSMTYGAPVEGLAVRPLELAGRAEGGLDPPAQQSRGLGDPHRF